MATSFVLSGGSNLGAAQVGMLKALFESGIVPSSIVGTSVGAINAAYVAGSPNLEGVLRLEQLWRSIKRADIFPFKPIRGFMGFVGRRDSLFSSSALEHLLDDNLSFERIEDATIPLSVVATEIRTGAEVVFSSGPTIPRVLASAALPGIFPSVTIDGVQFMDGAVADNTPISRPVLEGIDTIYVLACGTACGLTRAPHSSIGVVLQAFSVLVQQRLWQDVTRYSGICQLYVVPPLCPIQVNVLDFSRSGEILDAAYLSTKKWLAGGAPSAIDLLKPHTH